MIDPFTAATGIAGLLSLTIEVSKILYNVVNSFKNTPEDAKELLQELDQIRRVLTSLESFLRGGNAKRGSFRETSALIVATNGFSKEIKELKCKVQKLSDGQGLSRTIERSKWYFREEEHRKTITTLHRYLGMFQISLTIDGISLFSKSVDDVAQDIKGLTSAILTLTPDPQEAQRKSQQFDDILQLLSPLSEVTKDVSKTAETLQRWDEKWKGKTTGYRIFSKRLTPVDEESKGIVKWLSPLNFWTKQNDTFGRRQEGTGEWLLETDEFKKWLDGTERILWCPGLHYLERSLQQEDIAIASIYCSYKEEEAQTTVNLIASLLQQLVQRNQAISDEVVSLYSRHTKKGTRPTLGEYSRLLQSEVRGFSKVFIIVDALDECPESNGTRNSFLTEIRKLLNIRLLVTSRYISAIQREFEKTASVEIRASDGDIRRYLEGRIEREYRLERHVKACPILQETIVNTTVEKAKGMFLLAQLHMDSLASKRNRREVRKALENLPKELDDTYKEAMQRIESQDEGDVKLAEGVLSWISFALRPLTIRELQHALAVELEDTDIDEEALSDEEILVSVCAGLVTVDQESNIIRLVHYTTQEFFERIRVARFPGAQISIATTCLTYISFDVFAAGPCRSDQDMESRLHQYPLLDYAARHWGDHARGDPEETIKELALRFLDHNPKVTCSNQVMYIPGYRYSGYSQGFPERETGLSVVASIGLAKVVQLLLERDDVEADSEDGEGWTPLSLAAWHGHEAVVRLLVERDDVEADSKDGEGRTPLSWAAWQGHEAVSPRDFHASDSPSGVYTSYGGKTLPSQISKTG
ncbi:hypothetical protein FGG08_001970 [Glutinoglossum americanum]|uniref:Uncharacterized protein n=1 Tax=Glutinoglossum americanum TaxID=1670608 RepID=A0A9P8I5S9_9PEZI|nr:hypothetical protein FGG08_001970 [Glutinoglossum americanum]